MKLLYPIIWTLFFLWIGYSFIPKEREEPCRHVEFKKYMNDIKGHNVTLCITKKTSYQYGEHVDTPYSVNFFR